MSGIHLSHFDYQVWIYLILQSLQSPLLQDLERDQGEITHILYLLAELQHITS